MNIEAGRFAYIGSDEKEQADYDIYVLYGNDDTKTAQKVCKKIKELISKTKSQFYLNRVEIGKKANQRKVHTAMLEKNIKDFIDTKKEKVLIKVDNFIIY